MKVEKLVEIAQSLGGNAFLVGGAVRDELFGIEAHDKDFVLVGIENAKDLPFTHIAGKDFPVFLVEIEGEMCEVALARLERSNGNGHKDFEFITDASVTIEHDLLRRDLTINAMAKNLATGEIIDPFGGKDDLKNKVLRHVSDSFVEDPLRVFRLARFLTKFTDFEVADETEIMCFRMRNMLDKLSVERVFVEVRKALNGKNPRRFFDFLTEVNCLTDHFFKELNDLLVPDKHDITAFNHTMIAMNAGHDFEERFCLLCHDMGKGRTPKEFHPSHLAHDALGEGAVKDFCRRLAVPKKLRKVAIMCAKEHMRIRKVPEMKSGKALRFLLKNKNHWALLFNVSRIESGERTDATWWLKIDTIFGLAKAAEVAITGNDLIAKGIVPDSKFAEKLLNERVSVFGPMFKVAKNI